MKNLMVSSRNYMTRALSITLILGLLLSSLTFSSGLSEIFNTNVWADINGYWTDEGNYSIDWYDADADVYFITSAADLAGLAYLVNTGIDGVPVDFDYKEIRLDDQIDLGAHYWIPIGIGNIKDDKGIPQNVFKGDFDGQGYKIKNMNIGSEDSPATDVAGLFGYVDNGVGGSEYLELTNVVIENSNIYAINQANVGLLAGYINTCRKNVRIYNCCVNGTINANAEGTEVLDGITSGATGGIVGKVDFYNFLNSYKYIKILNCCNKATINSSANCTGGIVGIALNTYMDNKAGSTVLIKNCYSSGEINNDTGTYVGGIIGQANEKFNFSKNYFTYAFDAKNCVYEEGTADRGIGNDIGYEVDIKAMSHEMMTSDEEVEESLVNKLNNWIKNSSNSSESDLYSWRQFNNSKDSYPSLQYSMTSWLAVNEDNEFKYVDFSPFVEIDEDEEIDEYIISTPEQLAAVSALVLYSKYEDQELELFDTNGNSAAVTTFEGKTITLEADIDLGAHIWIPIGTTDNESWFSGSFNGNNHTISNMTLAAKTTGVGLFGGIKTNGTSEINICDLQIEDSNIFNNNGNFVGGLVGCIQNTSEEFSVNISDCSYTGNIVDSKARYIGGLIGVVQYTDSLSICNCTSDIKVKNTGNEFALGGIIGETVKYGNKGTSIELINCKTTGALVSNIAGTVGGLIGKGNSVDDISVESCTYDGCYSEAIGH